ncbi:unnamed protein product [Merluccius merluccius]
MRRSTLFRGEARLQPGPESRAERNHDDAVAAASAPRTSPSPPAQRGFLGELILSDLSSCHRGHRVRHGLG